MNNIEVDYLNLMEEVLNNGYSKGDRTGTGTISLFGRQIRHSMKLGFPLLTTKKMGFTQIASELAWFLKGDTNIRFLLENKNYIWVGDAYKRYLNECDDEELLLRNEFIEKILVDDTFNDRWGDLGPIYGRQWRGESTNQDFSFENHEYQPILFYKLRVNDQISKLYNELKENPDSRRLIVNSWDVKNLKDMTLPPCHFAFQFYTRELSLEERLATKEGIRFVEENTNPDLSITHLLLSDDNVPSRAISLMWYQRSVDLPLGLPYNIASYATLLQMFADEFAMVADELIGTLGDVHIYNNQIEGCKEQINRTPRELPTLVLDDGLETCLTSKYGYGLNGYNPHPAIKFPLSN